MAALASFYRVILRKSSTFWLTAAFGAVFFERGFDMITEGYFESRNKGKLWKDIKDKYE